MAFILTPSTEIQYRFKTWRETTKTAESSGRSDCTSNLRSPRFPEMRYNVLAKCGEKQKAVMHMMYKVSVIIVPLRYLQE